ncbi:MAG: peptide deformylase [bacterium]|nr:peptide deformylase [bacterium]
MALKILRYPDKRLKKVSAEVTDFEEAKKIALELEESTRNVDQPWKLWLGMAAPQIGYNKRLILIKKSFQKYKIMVNPKILEERWRFWTKSTCYSVPGLYLYRSNYWVKVRYQTLKGQTKKEILKGGKAIALKHEIDHLNGILLPDIAQRIL